MHVRFGSWQRAYCRVVDEFEEYLTRGWLLQFLLSMRLLVLEGKYYLVVCWYSAREGAFIDYGEKERMTSCTGNRISEAQ